MKTLSIVSPVYNEEGNIDAFYGRIVSVVSILKIKVELLFVNDGSTDSSVEKIRKLEKHSKLDIRIIHLSRNFGHQQAILCGMELAIGDAIVTLDSDLQDPPELIPQLVQEYLEGYDIVLAKRISRGKEPFLKKITANWYYKILKKISDVSIEENVADFRLISRQVRDELVKFQDQEPFLRGMTSWMGFKTAIVDYHRNERYSGSAKYTWKKMFKLAYKGIFDFTGFPLKLPFYLSAITAAASFIYVSTIIISRLLYPDNLVPGFSSIVILISTSFSLQMLMLGILGSYMRRIYIQSMRRPRYIYTRDEKL